MSLKLLHISIRFVIYGNLFVEFCTNFYSKYMTPIPKYRINLIFFFMFLLLGSSQVKKQVKTFLFNFTLKSKILLMSYSKHTVYFNAPALNLYMKYVEIEVCLCDRSRLFSENTRRIWRYWKSRSKGTLILILKAHKLLGYLDVI